MSIGGSMVKRKYADRSGWKRIMERKYAQTFLDTKAYTGYITLLHAIRVSSPLFVHYGERDLCIVDDGYMWLQQFPVNRHHTVTTMFDADGNIVQWYIDLCLGHGANNGTPWWDDLFLDIILLPSGELVVVDADELEAALANGVIHKQQAEWAWNEVERLKRSIKTGDFECITYAEHHKNQLIHMLESR